MAKENLAPLVLKAQSGNKDALNDLLAQTYETLYYYAYNTVKNEDQAADITQESCEEIIKTIGNLRNPEAFKTWAGRIVAHQCSRYYRQTKDEVYLDENEDGETILDRLPDDSRGSLPEQVQQDKEFKKLMWQMLDSLPEEQRQALVLYYMEDLSVPQIAEIQGKPEGTIKSRLNYGRKAVIAQVNEYEKKHNIKLHSLAPLPLLLYFLFRENMAQVLADSAATLEKVWQNISGAVAGTAVAGAAAAGTAATAGAAATGTGTATAATAAAAGSGLTAKVIAGVAAAVVATGAVVGGVILANQESPVEEYVGRWDSIPISILQAELYDTTDPMTIHKNGTLEYQGETYNLRFIEGEETWIGDTTLLAASPVDIAVPDADNVVLEDEYCIEFRSTDDGNIAYLYKATAYLEEYGEGYGNIDLITPFYRESDYEDYIKVELTEENVSQYLYASIVAYTINDYETTGQSYVESLATLWISQEFGEASYCILEPVLEYDIFQTSLYRFEDAYANTVRQEYGASSCGPSLYGAINQFRIQLPVAIQAERVRLVGATNVTGVIFVPKDWEQNHHHFFEWDCRISEDSHQWSCSCGETLDPQAHSFENGICACGYMPASQGLKFSVGSSSCSVTGIGTCTDTDVVIPAYYQGLPVTSIATNAFRDNKQITSVFIPSTVTFIDQWAFMNCPNLKEVHFSEGLQRTEDLVFIWCSSLEYIAFPSTLKETGHSLFNECTGLIDVTFPEGMTEIQHGMLSNCDSLISVTIPASVTSIGDKTFWHCTNLTEIHYGGTMEQWKQIHKGYEQTWKPDGTNWASDTGEFIVYCTDGQLSKTEAHQTN